MVEQFLDRYYIGWHCLLINNPLGFLPWDKGNAEPNVVALKTNEL